MEDLMHRRDIVQEWRVTMTINISGYGIRNHFSNKSYKSLNTNSKQYKAAAKDFLSAHRAEVAKMSPQEKRMYELFGGEEAYMRNVMKMYNSDGDFVGPGGIVVPGMVMNGIPESERHQIIDISEDARQKMFEETKRHFLQEYGVANGDTTKRSEVFREFQLSIPKEDRLKGTWTLGQYEKAYRQAFYDAVKAADPNWDLGSSFNRKVLDSVTRESVDNALVKSGNTLVLPRKTVDISV